MINDKIKDNDDRDERDEDCVISFQTESILEKFLLKVTIFALILQQKLREKNWRRKIMKIHNDNQFPRLHMDCNDHLYIYDGAHATGNFRVRW